MKRLIYILFLLVLSPLVRAEGDYQRGISYYKQGQYAKAASEFDQLVSANPKYEDGWRILGDCYLKLKKYNDAATSFQKALQLDSNKFVSYLGLSIAYYNTDRYKDAVATLNRAESMARTPKDQIQVYRTRGAAQYNLKQWDGAVADLNKAAAIQRPNYQDSLQLGIANYNLGNVSEADKYLRQALALNGSSTDARKYLNQMDYARAVNALENKKFDQASSLFKEHLGEHPQDGDAWFNYGLARLFSQDLKGAEEAFLQSAKLAPDNWQTHDRLGYIYEKSKNFPKALEQYKRASAMSQNGQVKASVQRVQERIRRQQQGNQPPTGAS